MEFICQTKIGFTLDCKFNYFKTILMETAIAKKAVMMANLLTSITKRNHTSN